ncbi:hypothetical protein WA845_04235 [Agrobacterium sp. CMT1]|uniref:P-loop ATPase, Sll1717 family n=1 Tax=Agrobacterium sp. CMT1 TaxID=3128901 RepID=UPI0030772294
MKAFTELNLGFTNAENYRKRANKELLAKYFVRDEYLEKLLNHNVYYLVGEKGTGKTAYSTYLSNTKYKNVNSFSYDVRQTEYHKFMELKRRGHLPLSQYSDVWRTLLLILSAASILERSNTPEFLRRFTKLNALKMALDEFYSNAFAPEIIKVLNFVESSELSASLIAKYDKMKSGVESKIKSEKKDSNSTFQKNLLDIRRAFEDAIEALKLDEDYVIFIDGIDVRPSDIPYDEYFECVRGLIDAVWAINNDFLSNIKDSKGRVRVVLLVRPDIFLRTGLHNVNTKIRDNSVFLNWMTTYNNFRSSALYKVADRILSAQQDEPMSEGQGWEYYFPFKTTSAKDRDDERITSFLSFLRFSYYRPRDINAMMGTMKEILERKGPAQTVSDKDFNDPSFRDAHADYLLGEIRDQLLFYYSQDDFETFLRFFSHLRGKSRFSYGEFVDSHISFIAECNSQSVKVPQFLESADAFLQFLYELNVICYKELDEDNPSAEPFIRWCFKERTPSNLSPKIRHYVDYEIFYGLSKALNVGRKIQVKNNRPTREIGTVTVVTKGKFGFIRGGPDQADHYFQWKQLADGYSPAVGDKVSFEPSVKYGKIRALTVRRER